MSMAAAAAASFSPPGRFSPVAARRRKQLPAAGNLRPSAVVAAAPVKVLDDSEIDPRGVMDFIEGSKDLIRSDGGPPRWFSPVECGSRAVDSPPPLFFLPGIDGVGLGLIRHHQRLAKIYDVWCLHIPVMDRTPFEGLIEYVERTVKSENFCLPNKPIYLVGESLGACVALSVAARNPDIDFILILANPATSFCKSQLQSLPIFLDVIPEPLHVTVPYFLSFITVLGYVSRPTALIGRLLCMETLQPRMGLPKALGFPYDKWYQIRTKEKHGRGWAKDMIDWSLSLTRLLTMVRCGLRHVLSPTWSGRSKAKWTSHRVAKNASMSWRSMSPNWIRPRSPLPI